VGNRSCRPRLRAATRAPARSSPPWTATPTTRVDALPGRDDRAGVRPGRSAQLATAPSIRCRRSALVERGRRDFVVGGPTRPDITAFAERAKERYHRDRSPRRRARFVAVQVIVLRVPVCRYHGTFTLDGAPITTTFTYPAPSGLAASAPSVGRVSACASRVAPRSRCSTLGPCTITANQA